VGLLLQPAALIFQIGDFVSVDSLVGSPPFQEAGVVEHKEALGEVGLEVFSDPAFVVPLEIPILPQLVYFGVALGQLILVLCCLVHIDEVVGVLEPPYFVVGGLEASEAFDFVLDVVVDYGE